MKAKGKSIITGRYADSLTRQAGLRRDGASECSPLGGLSVEYISLSWADVMSCAASCALQILSYIWAFQISMYYLIVSVAHQQIMVNKTVLTQLSELLEKRDLKEIAAGTIVEATEVTDHGNFSLSACLHSTLLRLYERRWEKP